MNTPRATELKEHERSYAAALARALEAPLDEAAATAALTDMTQAIVAMSASTRDAFDKQPASAPLLALLERATKLEDGLHHNVHFEISRHLADAPEAIFLPYYFYRLRSPLASSSISALTRLPAAQIAGPFLDWYAGHENDPSIREKADLAHIAIKCRLAQTPSGTKVEIPESTLRWWVSYLDVEAVSLALAHGLSPDVDEAPGIGLLHFAIASWIQAASNGDDGTGTAAWETIVRALVAHGANPNRKLAARLEMEGTWGAKKGTTALGVIAEARRSNVADGELLTRVQEALEASAG